MAQAKIPISVTIIALNEEAKIGRALDSVAWAEDVVVVDSGSRDQTVEVARSKGARVLHNTWAGYGQQKNFAQDQAKFDWVLNIDADETVPPALAEEIAGALATAARNQITGYALPRKTFYLGRWIRHGGWYPNYLVRFANRKEARWSEPHVHESWEVRGKVACLRNPLEHDAFGSIEDQIRTNLRFSRLGSQDLLKKGRRASLPKLLLKPLGKFIETYFLKLGCLDGLPGLIISINAAHSMFLKYAFLTESRIQGKA